MHLWLLYVYAKQYNRQSTGRPTPYSRTSSDLKKILAVVDNVRLFHPNIAYGQLV